MEDSKKKKMGVKDWLNLISKIGVILILVLAVFMTIFTVVSVAVFDRTDRGIFGLHAFVVESDSMSATDFKAGDLILVKKVDAGDLQAGDIITFQSLNQDSYGKIVTHKIREKVRTEDGRLGFVTYGTTTGSNDEAVVTSEFIIGEYSFRLAGVGRFFHFLKTPMGYVFCIFIPFLLLILWQGLGSLRLFRQYRAEQQAEIDAQRAEQQAELEENRRVLEELQRLKAELGEKTELAGSKGDPEKQDNSESAEAEKEEAAESDSGEEEPQ